MAARHKNYFWGIIPLILLGLATLLFFLARGHSLALFNPQGPIAHQERNLMVTAIVLMLAVALPVLLALAWIVWRYRADNTRNAAYTPNWDRHLGTQIGIWGIVGTLIFILSILNWQSTHKLDPYKPLVSETPPITIQVVALQWRWLFVYPAQGIATINYLELPSNTPVNFQLTADAPMNSFWIPQLGGQMYAMPGMSTQLHLEASNPGEFNGSAAEISGAGFAGMKFKVVAAKASDFDNWVATIKNGSNHLDQAEYQRLARPSEDSAVAYYSAVPFDLYNSVIIKYMAPPAEEAL